MRVVERSVTRNQTLEHYLVLCRHSEAQGRRYLTTVTLGTGLCVHRITTRTPRPDEQRLIAGRTKPDFASYGCITIFFAVVPGLLLSKFGGWLGGFISADVSTYGQWIGGAIAAIIFVSLLVSFIPHERRRRQRASQDHSAQIVQDIHVTEPRVIEIALINDSEPILAFEIGDKKILYLQGQWLRDDATYGADLLEGDACEEFINGLPEPHSFPSTEFTVSRFPNSGEVVGILVAGRYLAPEAEVEALKSEYEFGDSELFEGSLDDIAGVLAREHERRKSR